LESFCQAIRSPLQVLLVGEPLAAPWGKPAPVTLANLGGTGLTVRGEAQFLAAPFGAPPRDAPEFLYLLDGRSLPAPTRDPLLKLDSRQLTDGYHELRVVTYANALVRSQAFATAGFLVDNRGHYATLPGLAADAALDLHHAGPLDIASADGAATVGIIAQERVLVHAPRTGAVTTVYLEPAQLGPGPNNLQAVALYGGQQAVRGAPAPVEVKPLNRPPRLRNVFKTPTAAGGLQIRVEADDAEGDPVRLEWLQPLFALSRDSAVFGGAALTNGQLAWRGDALQLYGETGRTARIFAELDTARLSTLDAEIAGPLHGMTDQPEFAGLIFDGQSEADFSFFGLFGDTCSWALGRVEKGELKRQMTRGLYYEEGRWFHLTLREVRDGLAVYVDDVLLLRAPGWKMRGGRIGLLGGAGQSAFRRLMLSPPAWPPGGWTTDVERLQVTAEAARENRSLRLRAADPFGKTEQEIPL
jgi:hypothetical protein